MLKKKTRRDKRRHVSELACEAEVAVRQRNMKELYKIMRQQLDRWREHFSELLNRPPPEITPEIKMKGRNHKSHQKAEGGQSTES